MSSPTLQPVFEQFARLRRSVLSRIDEVPETSRSTIPSGLKNNLHWQSGHLLTVQMSLLYKRCGEPVPIGEEFFTSFGKGTSPAAWTDATPSFQTVRSLLESSLTDLENDLERMAEKKYPTVITVSTGDEIGSFAEALRFLPVHEALHLGVITAMNRILTRDGK